MSGKERVIAALLLAIAVAGGAVIPRLLGAAPSAPLGIALGPGPSRSVVQAPSIPKPPSHGSARSTPSPQNAVRPSPVVSSVPAPHTNRSSTPPAKPPTHPSPPHSPPPPSPPPPSPPPPSPPPPSPPPPTTTPTQPPALMPQAPTRPGHGYGDKNHTHTGPPGHADRPATTAKPTRRSHGADVPGSGHGRPSTQAPSHPVGHHHRRVGRVAAPASGAAAHAHEARPKARPKARGSRGKGRRGTHPPQQVTHGSSTHDSPLPPAAPAAPTTGNNGHGQSGQGNGQANGHQGHGKGQG
jgi:hypothetical protein